MDRKLTILAPLFEDPQRAFYLRELARLARMTHAGLRGHFEKFAREGLVKKEKLGVWPAYQANTSQAYRNLKLFYNLEKIRKSGIVEALEKAFDYPVIVVFGSYQKAMDEKSSDIDLCIISNIQKEFNPAPFEKLLHRPVSIHHFTKATWERAKKNNPELINNICNGIVLSGQLEVVS